ncbi:MAG: hypothetical protein AB8B85_20990 [Paracoccaceae bacterium]
MIKRTRVAELGRVGPSTSKLALDLTNDAVTLCEVARDGSWHAIAAVPTDTPDFLDQLSNLRMEARVRHESASPITLWLPPEQVLVRSYDLPANDPDARFQARARLADETPYAAKDLMIALGPRENGQPTKVLGALCQTVVEAREYARKWGFVPGAVSTRVEAATFAPAGPIFRVPEPAPVRLARRAASVGLAACVGAAALLGIYAISQVVEPLVVPTVKNADSNLMFALMQVEDRPPVMPPAPLRPVGAGSAQMLAIQRAIVTIDPGRSMLTEQRGAPVHLAGAPELPIPKTRPRLKVGSAPRLPQRARPGRLTLTAVIPKRRPVDLMRNALDAVRSEGKTLAKTPKRRRIEPAEPIASEAESGSLVAATLPRTQPSPARIPENAQSPQIDPKTLLEAPVQEAEQAANDDNFKPTALAPQNINLPPLPRPVKTALQTADKQQADGTAPAESQEAPLPSAAPKPDHTAAQPTASLVVPDAKPAPPEVSEEVDETPTKFAALSAPKPRVRPEGLEAKPVLKQPSSTALRDNAPRSVRTAAVETGLNMGETNLIGVLHGTKGRQALVRLRSGGYQKVSRGDVVDGWRVSAIGRETLRLSRRGQNRTLMLVSR